MVHRLAIQESDIDSENSINGRTQLFLVFFWAGFIVYTLIHTLLMTEHIPLSLVILTQVIQLGALMLLLLSSLMIMQGGIKNTYLLIMFVIYTAWHLLVIARGFVANTEFIKTSLLDSWFGMVIYFAPFAMLFTRKAPALKMLFNAIIILGIFYLLFNMLFIREYFYRWGDPRKAQALVEYMSRNLAMAAGFILLSYIFNGNQKNMIALAVVVIMFLFAALRARRAIMFMSMTMMVLAYAVFYFSSRGQIVKIFFSVVLVLSMGMYGAYMYSMQKSGTFGLLSSRLHEDTRSRVVNDFYRDMGTIDWLIGRGANGQYYCPGVDEGNRVTTTRFVIETGYLQIILKGGLVSLALLLLIAIPAMIRGFFYSKNLLAKASALWVFWFIINLYASVGNSFVLSYILLWIAIGICFDPQLTEKSDEELKKLLL